MDSIENNPILAGDIKVYVEHTLKPIIEFKDPNPLQIKYFGFSSLGQSLARYFYACRGDEVYTKAQLNARCQYANVSSAVHTQFHPIPTNSIADTDRYSIEIPMHVAASHDARMVVASDNSFNSIRNGYEFGMYCLSVCSTRWHLALFDTCQFHRYNICFFLFRSLNVCQILVTCVLMCEL